MALIEEQGEMIDLIDHEYNIELVAAHMEVGQQNIHRVAEYSCSNRRVSGKFIIIKVFRGGGGGGCICSLLGSIYPPFQYGVAPLPRISHFGTSTKIHVVL